MIEEIRTLDYDTVVLIQQIAIARFSGYQGVRDKGLLESALALPMQSFEGTEFYPTIADKAARLCWGISLNHPFIDGNKRAATAVLGTFLRINGYDFEPDADELLSMMIGIADGTRTYENLRDWVDAEIGANQS
ncbi:MAG: type II toxin-antitoxin system death-on-curing family toxin [Eggerthellaceae bacterium]|nr:type II toxin-antitoxin system death-on-curing family toxin [Eggerthellaceae bacterium]